MGDLFGKYSLTNGVVLFVLRATERNSGEVRNFVAPGFASGRDFGAKFASRNVPCNLFVYIQVDKTIDVFFYKFISKETYMSTAFKFAALSKPTSQCSSQAAATSVLHSN